MSFLIHGKIPANTECKWKAECPLKNCHHQGVNHSVPYSCAVARAYELSEEFKKDSSKN